MKRHRGILVGLATIALLGLMETQGHAGSITLTVDLNGMVIFTATSIAPDQTLSPGLTALNTALSDAGSAYQFSSLVATSNFFGDGTAFLTTTGSIYINPTGAGTTAATLSVDTVQSGFLSPVPLGSVTSTATGGCTLAVGSMCFTSQDNGTGPPPLFFSFAPSLPYPPPPAILYLANTPTIGSTSYTGSYTGSSAPLSVTNPSGFELSSQFLFNFTDNPGFTFNFPGTIEVSSIPEPSSILLLLTGIPLPLSIAFGFIRRRGRERSQGSSVL